MKYLAHKTFDEHSGLLQSSLFVPGLAGQELNLVFQKGLIVFIKKNIHRSVFGSPKSLLDTNIVPTL